MGDFLSKITTTSGDNLETFTLVWLDANVNKNKENQCAQEELQATIHQVKPFAEPGPCEEFIKLVSNKDRIVLIVSGSLSQKMIPRIHTLEQLLSIYIYCGDVKIYDESSKTFPKVKAVVSNLSELIARIQFDHTKRQQNRIYESLPISIFDSKIIHEKLTTDLRGHLVQSQLLINSLLGMQSRDGDRVPLISLSKQIYRKNPTELRTIQEFEQSYSPNQAIRWYTRDSFLSRILNKALRTQNIELLFLFQFFIHDIQQQLEASRCKESIRAYRCQLMSEDELKLLRGARGQFISINSFLSATTNSKELVSHIEANAHLQPVLFVIDADPTPQDTKPFANIRRWSSNNEDEILFMIGSIFQIIKVDCQQQQYCKVQLKLCADNHEQLSALKDKNDLLSFGHVLMTMGKIDEAEIYYKRLSEQLSPNDPQLTRSFHELAVIAEKRGDYEASIQYYDKSLENNSNIESASALESASNYTGLGEVSRQKRDFPRALHYYTLALHILERSSTEESRRQAATVLNHIGTIHHEQQNFKDAIARYKEAIGIHEKLTPVDETSLGILNNNIGNVYYCQRDYEPAFDFYKKALAMYGKTLPEGHPKFASTYNNIGAMFQEQGKDEKALDYFTAALKIYERIHPPSHPNVVIIQNNIQRLTKKERR